VFDRRGQIRIIEAFFSIGVVFSVLLVSVTFPSQPDLTGQKQLASLGTQVLMELDANGTLGNLIAQRNWTAIKTCLDVLLPLGVTFNLTVYDENMLQINSQLIQNSNLQGQEVVSVERVCATQTPTIEFYILRLQLAWTK
jgi:hypothetical protein